MTEDNDFAAQALIDWEETFKKELQESIKPLPPKEHIKFSKLLEEPVKFGETDWK